MARREPNILVVDDEQDTCDNLRDILSDLGYHVDVALDGPAAIRLLDSRAYDVALLDFKLPGMDGLALYREIRRRRTDTVAMILTAFASPETAHEALTAGAKQVMSKPIDMHQLLTSIQTALEQPSVLIVDDDQDLCLSLSDVLQEQGIRVSIVHSLHDLTARLHELNVDVALIDLKLADASGVEACRVLRDALPHTRVLVVTAYREEMSAQLDAAIASGIDAVVFKPLHTELLLDQIRQLTLAVDCSESLES